ncbi:MAG TPA: hypothetical protein PKD26_11675 [Pyrinomonadaceae bacterium]|nr:hypothetical protein [Pyrinomonadaceae bacterium]
MKNSLNLALIFLLLVVLGCSCQRLQELTAEKDSPPASSPSTSNTTSVPERTPGATSTSGLTMAKYNQLKIDMDKREVEKILGGPGEEISTTSGGGSTFSVYKWSGENFTSIIISFRNDKIMTKSQVGLK